MRPTPWLLAGIVTLLVAGCVGTQESQNTTATPATNDTLNQTTNATCPTGPTTGNGAGDITPTVDCRATNATP